MASKFASMSEAVERGQVAPLTRLVKGVPKTLLLLPTLHANAQGVPLWFLVLKGAWESGGNPGAVSKSKKDVGLFQIIIKPGQTLKGYTYEQFKDPAINTRVFAGRINAWRQRLAKEHGAWFPEGMNSASVWGIIWLFGAIGSHATRYIMNSIGPGFNTFGRIVDFALTMPNWFSGGDQRQHWGVQSPELVVFRIIIAKRVMTYGLGVREQVAERIGSLGPLAAPKGLVGLGIVLGFAALAAPAAVLGYLVYKDRDKFQREAVV